MRNFLKNNCFIVLILFLVSCASKDIRPAFQNALTKFDHPYVLLISFDGFKHDYIDRFQPPHITSFFKKGVRAKGLRPIYPSSTFPNHYTIITGLYAGNHGIIANSFYDEKNDRTYIISNPKAVTDGSYYGGEPLWNTVQKNGMASATYYWPGSEANINNQYPTYYLKYEHTTAHAIRIKQIIDWFKLPSELRPHLVTLYFPDTDDYGHFHGTDSNEIKDAVMNLDNTFGQLISEIEKLPFKVNVVLLSDHGMQNQQKDKVEYLDDCIDLKDVQAFGYGPYSNLYIKDKTKVRSIEKKLNQCKKIFRAYRREKLPEKYHYNHPHVGDVHVNTKVPYAISTRDQTKFRAGEHGYDPENESMHGIFLARGPGIKEGLVIETFDNIHIYPFLAKLLKVDYQHKVDGSLSVLEKILKEEK